MLQLAAKKIPTRFGRNRQAKLDRLASLNSLRHPAAV